MPIKFLVKNRALRQLVQDKEFVLTKSDKANSVVVLPTSKYLALDPKHLREIKTYQLHTTIQHRKHTL